MKAATLGYSNFGCVNAKVVDLIRLTQPFYVLQVFIQPILFGVPMVRKFCSLLRMRVIRFLWRRLLVFHVHEPNFIVARFENCHIEKRR